MIYFFLMSWVTKPSIHLLLFRMFLSSLERRRASFNILTHWTSTWTEHITVNRLSSRPPVLASPTPHYRVKLNAFRHKVEWIIGTASTVLLCRLFCLPGQETNGHASDYVSITRLFCEDDPDRNLDVSDVKVPVEAINLWWQRQRGLGGSSPDVKSLLKGGLGNNIASEVKF